MSTQDDQGEVGHYKSPYYPYLKKKKYIYRSGICKNVNINESSTYFLLDGHFFSKRTIVYTTSFDRLNCTRTRDCSKNISYI